MTGLLLISITKILKAKRRLKAYLDWSSILTTSALSR